MTPAAFCVAVLKCVVHACATREGALPITASCVMDLIRCSYVAIPNNSADTYIILPRPLKGTLFVSFDNLGFLSGQVRVRRKGGGKYPFHYLEMLDYVFGREENTIEVCSGSVDGGCLTVDIDPKTKRMMPE